MNDIHDILAKHFSGEGSPEEEKLALDWKQKNEVEYKQLHKLWQSKNDSVEFPTFNPEKAWKQIDSQLVVNKKKSFKLYWVGAAASVAIIISAFLFMGQNDTIVLANKTTHTEKHLLPDGSELWLAANSQVTYSENFEENRSLDLTGTAYFEVERDENHPFIIHHAYGEVEVLGTGFNVEVGTDQAEITVAHGKVAVRNSTGEEVVITDNQSAIASQESISNPQISEVNALSWKTGKFTFEDESLENVVSYLNQHYTRKIEFDSTVDIENLPHLNATFENQSLEEVIEIIVVTCGIKADFQKDKVVLK